MQKILQINTDSDWHKTIFKDFGVTRFSTPFCNLNTLHGSHIHRIKLLHEDIRSQEIKWAYHEF